MFTCPAKNSRLNVVYIPWSRSVTAYIVFENSHTRNPPPFGVTWECSAQECNNNNVVSPAKILESKGFSSIAKTFKVSQIDFTQIKLPSVTKRVFSSPDYLGAMSFFAIGNGIENVPRFEKAAHFSIFTKYCFIFWISHRLDCSLFLGFLRKVEK